MIFPLLAAAGCLSMLFVLLPRTAANETETKEPAAPPPPPPQEGPNGIRIGDRFIMPHTVSIHGDAEFAPCIILAGSEVTAVGFAGTDWVKVRYDRIPVETAADIPYATGIMAKECKDKSTVSFSPDYFNKLKGDMPRFPLRAGYGVPPNREASILATGEDEQKE
jgi:hypothetical protein